MIAKDMITELQKYPPDSKIFMEDAREYVEASAVVEASEVEEAVIGLLEGVVIRFKN